MVGERRGGRRGRLLIVMGVWRRDGVEWWGVDIRIYEVVAPFFLVWRETARSIG